MTATTPRRLSSSKKLSGTDKRGLKTRLLNWSQHLFQEYREERQPIHPRAHLREPFIGGCAGKLNCEDSRECAGKLFRSKARMLNF